MRFTVILACTAAGNVATNGYIQGEKGTQEVEYSIRCCGQGTIHGMEWCRADKGMDPTCPAYTPRWSMLCLVWDTFSGHMTEDVSEELRKKNITTAVIPGGCTSKIQPLDVLTNHSKALAGASDKGRKGWIGCDGPGCNRWFHYWCVGYKRKPSVNHCLRAMLNANLIINWLRHLPLFIN